MRKFSRFLIAFLFCFIVMEAVGLTRATPNLYEGSPSSGFPQFGQVLQKASGIFHKFVAQLPKVLPPQHIHSLIPVTFDITGTAGFETGLQRLAFLRLAHLPDPNAKTRPAAMVNWGDGTSPDPGLLQCGGFLPINPCYVFGTHVYQNAGTYTITINYFGFGPFHLPLTASTTAKISSVPKSNFVILTIGDSVASGEGNPVIPFGFKSGMRGAYWDDPPSDYSNPLGGGCHRSRRAGFAMAANEVSAENPVTAINLACSGDTESQTVAALAYARRHLKHIDVLLISVGADDYVGPSGQSGFGNLITTCVPLAPLVSNYISSLHAGPLASVTPCYLDPTKQDTVYDFTQQLPQAYSDLAKNINCLDPTDSGDSSNDQDSDSVNGAACTLQDVPKLVLITQYFDPTHDAKSLFPNATDYPCSLATSGASMAWLYNNVVVPMNRDVDAFPNDALQAGLTVPTYAVTGLQQEFLPHGYCAGPFRWVNTLADSLGLQLNPNGTGHPNRLGQAVYQESIYNAIVKYNPPVVTASATKVSGLDPSTYQFDTWTSKSVKVSLSNPDQAIKASGIGSTYYAVDDPSCMSAFQGGNCTLYSGPFTIDTSGQHTVTFFGTNGQGYPERAQSVEVLIDKSRNQDIAISPATQTIPAGWDVSYPVSLGHTGWPTRTVNLFCTTTVPSSNCTMQQSEVMVNGTNPPMSTAVVSTKGCPAPTFDQPSTPCSSDPPGTYTVIVTAVSGTSTKSASATLVINPGPSDVDQEP